jgi:hypothetical protein
LKFHTSKILFNEEEAHLIIIKSIVGDSHKSIKRDIALSEIIEINVADSAADFDQKLD